MPRVLITVEGGVVQNVESDIDDLQVMLMDFDERDDPVWYPVDRLNPDEWRLMKLSADEEEAEDGKE